MQAILDDLKGKVRAAATVYEVHLKTRPEFRDNLREEMGQFLDEAHKLEVSRPDF